MLKPTCILKHTIILTMHHKQLLAGDVTSPSVHSTQTPFHKSTKTYTEWPGIESKGEQLFELNRYLQWTLEHIEARAADELHFGSCEVRKLLILLGWASRPSRSGNTKAKHVRCQQEASDLPKVSSRFHNVHILFSSFSSANLNSKHTEVRSIIFRTNSPYSHSPPEATAGLWWHWTPPTAKHHLPLSLRSYRANLEASLLKHLPFKTQICLNSTLLLEVTTKSNEIFSASFHCGS